MLRSKHYYPLISIKVLCLRSLSAFDFLGSFIGVDHSLIYSLWPPEAPETQVFVCVFASVWEPGCSDLFLVGGHKCVCIHHWVHFYRPSLWTGPPFPLFWKYTQDAHSQTMQTYGHQPAFPIYSIAPDGLLWCIYEGQVWLQSYIPSIAGTTGLSDFSHQVRQETFCPSMFDLWQLQA